MNSKDKLLALINQHNPLPIPLSFSNVNFSLPIEDIGDNWNTVVRINALSVNLYSGYQDVYYKRNHVSELLPNGIGLLSEEPFTFEKIINLLNDERNAEIDLTEVEAVDLSNLDFGATETVQLKATDSSLGWIGETPMSVVFGLPSNINELHNLVNHTLPEPGYIT